MDGEGLRVADIEPILQTIDLTRSFDMVKAADAINVTIGHGEVVGIVGANGSGKTTFLNLITGYVKPDRGRILIMGRDSAGLPHVSSPNGVSPAPSKSRSSIPG